MHRIAVSIALACMLVAPIRAQDAKPIDGKWIGRFPGQFQGVPREMTFTIDGEKGVWQYQSVDRNDRCIGLPYPVTISNLSPEGFEARVEGSKAMPGCQDGTFRIRRAEDGTLQTQFRDGRKIVFSRQ